MKKVTNAIFIPGNVPSSKNSKVKTSRGIFHSKAVGKYLRELGVQHFSSSRKEVKEYKTRPNVFKDSFDQEFLDKLNSVDGPLILGFHFVRKTKADFDFINMCQIVHDLMVAHDFINDDNMNELIPVPFRINKSWYTHDKNNPGVWIKFYKKINI